MQKNVKKFEAAYNFVNGVAAEGGTVLFIGTKKQAAETIKEEALKCGMCYVNVRWPGGMLTNFKTIRKSINRLNELEKMREDGTFDLLPKKEVAKKLKEIEDDAFEHCDGLTEIVFPASLTHIGDLAFRGCRGLKRVSFEAPDGWYETCRYDRSHTPLDLSAPERNARWLARVDFDDGPDGWYKQK